MSRAFFFLMAFCLTFTFPVARAAGFCPDLTQGQHPLGPEQGLSQSVVTALAEDAEGRIWLGTQAGLNRYDGYQLQVWRAEQLASTASLLSADITALAPGREGMWVGTTRGLAQVQRDGTVRRWSLGETPPGRVLAVAEDARGQVLIGTADQGVWWRASGQPAFAPLSLEASAAQDKAQDKVQDAVHDSAPVVRALHADGRQFWLASTRGLYRYQPESGQMSRVPATETLNVVAVLRDRRGRLNLATTRGLWWLEGDRQLQPTPLQWPEGVAMPGVQALAEDAAQRLWLGTAKGLHLLDADRQTVCRPHQAAEGEPLPDVMTLLTDRNGQMWWGTYAGGAYRMPEMPKGMRALQPPGAGRRPAITAVWRDARGQNWLGTADRGLFVELDGQWRRGAEPGEGLPEAPIIGLLEDSDGRFWVATAGGGLAVRAAGATGFRVFDKAALGSDYLYALHEDHGGAVWVGSEQGLLRFPAGSLQPESYSSRLPAAFSVIDTAVMAVVEDSRGRLWVGGPAGLAVLEPGLASGRLVPPPGPAGSVWSVMALRLTPDGALWVGTGNGLWRLDAREADPARWSIRRWEARDGAPLHAVYSLVVGGPNQLWVGSSSGLLALDLTRRETTVFRRALGLPAEEFNQGAAHLAADGVILFGGVGGGLQVQPDALRLPGTMTPVLVAWRRLNEPQALPQGDPQAMVLRETDRVLSFDFALADLRAPEQNRYRYRLLGLHTDWLPFPEGRTLMLTGLAAGEYKLEVQAAAAGHAWSEHALQLSLTVQAAAPEKASVALLVAVVTAGLATLVGAMRMRGKRRRRAELVLIRARQGLQRARAEAERSRKALQQQQDATVRVEQARRALENELQARQGLEPITGLPGRIRFRQQLLTAARPLSVAILELDGFERLTETLGFDAREALLQAVTRLLVDSLGGQWFCWDVHRLVWLWPGDDVALMSARAEQCRLRVLQSAFVLAGRKTADLSLSLGVVLAVPSTALPEDALERLALQALKLARDSGRNTWIALDLRDAPEAQVRRLLSVGLEPLWRNGTQAVLRP